ncbi:MAG: class I SAM-dependent DNA methyltransferase [Bacteroidetes bacterium]|nr:class I SAM-dependent DNA methyltransferase [Bacteroidota bacterium]
MTEIQTFISRWKTASGTERANYQMFLTELADLLGVDKPEPATSDTSENAYVFERLVTMYSGSGSHSHGFIDFYRRGSFVCEAKKIRASEDGSKFSDAMLRARSQAELYARSLPALEGRPPFLLVVDVGNVIEIFSEFTRTGATYVPFPDTLSHRIRLEDLQKPDVQELLRAIWNDPDSLDPSRRSARVTKEIALTLASLARSFELDGHEPGSVARFLTRCLFTFFVEDIGLFPKRAFTTLLEQMRERPQQLASMIGEIWTVMDEGGFSTSIREDVRRFNGRLFKERDVLTLTTPIIDKLIEAGNRDWRDVEPAIFGTLLERALDPVERHNLGAHFTPRAYVERLVQPTVIGPLRSEWDLARTAALTALAEGDRAEALRHVRLFHHRLCSLRILDPACGSGNFLYVTLEHLKRLEGEVLLFLEDLGEQRARFDLAGVTVDPHQFLGIEVNPRAAAMADLVLWIGYLQWHVRTHGDVRPIEPIIKDFGNITCMDAVLGWDNRIPAMRSDGTAETRWDGRTFVEHPVTGKLVPDENARVQIYSYVRPRQSTWPSADIVIGNPPFIGAKWIKESLGDGYALALRSVYQNVPESADYVMYWWDKAAELLRNDEIERFGFITTNSIKQVFNRRVIAHHVASDPPVSICYAIPDHPWVDAAQGAAVRIAMTVAEAGFKSGILEIVVQEEPNEDGSSSTILHRSSGMIHVDLRIGADLNAAHELRSNLDVSNRGVQLFGAGFIVTRLQAAELGLGRVQGLENHIREYRNGKDVTARPRDVLVIDLFGLSEDEARIKFPEVYQWVLQRVKPERDQNNRDSRKRNWWLFGETNPKLRRQLSGLEQFVSTAATAKHRVFQLMADTILPDDSLINIASSDSWVLGALMSRIHCLWALSIGSDLGGNTPRYIKSLCFEKFPFPLQRGQPDEAIELYAQRIDTHIKRQLELHPTLTITDIYNVVEACRSCTALTAKERIIHEHGLVDILREYHDELDRLVFDAYGWDDLAARLVGKPGATCTSDFKSAEQIDAENELLQRLVDLNHQRFQEEQNGVVHWLRPEFQRKAKDAPTQASMGITHASGKKLESQATLERLPWPTDLVEQVQAISRLLDRFGSDVTVDTVSSQFKRARKNRVSQIIDTLRMLGR